MNSDSNVASKLNAARASLSRFVFLFMHTGLDCRLLRLKLAGRIRERYREVKAYEIFIRAER